MTTYKDKTGEFLRYILPPKDRIYWSPDQDYDSNHVIFRSLIIYGSPGSGKTEIARKITEEAVKAYGEENVNASITTSEYPLMMLGDVLDSKDIQILVFDDATLQNIKKHSIRGFFQIRNIWKEKTKKNKGFILAMFITHRFHGLTTEFRTNADAIIWKSAPFNKYDVQVVKSYLGDSGVKALRTIEYKRISNPYWNSVSVFCTKVGIKGLLQLPLATKNYLREYKG